MATSGASELQACKTWQRYYRVHGPYVVAPRGVAMLTWLSKHLFFRPLGNQRRRSPPSIPASAVKSQLVECRKTLRKWQWKRSARRSDTPSPMCSYYKERYGAAGSTDAHKLGGFRRFPLLRKKDIRESGDGLISERFRREDLDEARTGGSTGTALTLYFDERCQELRNAAAMRSDQWAGWDIGMKVAAIWGNPPVADTLKKKLRNLLLDRIIYLDTMDINECSVRRFVEEWRREKPRVIFGHSHSIYILGTVPAGTGGQRPAAGGHHFHVDDAPCPGARFIEQCSVASPTATVARWPDCLRMRAAQRVAFERRTTS